MLYQVLTHIRNFFVAPNGTHEGVFTLRDNNIYIDDAGVQQPITFLQEGQYFLIQGSVFHDGVFRYPCECKVEERFTGSVSALCIPQEVVDLALDIEEWQKKYGDPTPYMSESFGGYSYTKATQGSTGTATWQEAFRNRLHTWRKI